MKFGGTRGLEEATVGVGNRGLVSAPGKVGAYSLFKEQLLCRLVTDSIDIAGCSSLIQAPLDCEQSSRVHKTGVLARTSERIGFDNLSTTPFHRCGK